MAKIMKIKRFSILLILFVLFFPILISQINIVDSTLRVNNKNNILPYLSNNNVELEWNRSWGGIGQDIAIDIGIDSANNIYVTGGYNMATMGASAFLLKYNSSGGLEWSRTWADTGLTFIYSIAFDSSNNIYLTGYTYTGVDAFTTTMQPEWEGTMLWQCLKEVAEKCEALFYCGDHTHGWKDWQLFASGSRTCLDEMIALKGNINRISNKA